MATNRITVAVCAAFLSACSQASDQAANSAEHRQITRECRFVATIKQNVCRITFAELASNAKAFDGQYIRVTGFALNEQEFTYLYASREAYVYGAARGGVDLLIPEEMRSAFVAAASDTTKPVTLIGKFDVLRGRLPGSIGVLSGPGLSFYVDNFPWEAPALPPTE